MRGPQFAIRALLVGILIGGVFGGAALPVATRPLEPRVDLASAHLSLATPAVPAATEQSVSQIIFAGPNGMTINWDVTEHDKFDSDPLKVPGRYNFPCGAIYRLRLTDIPGRDGMVIYPTLEVAPPLPRTEAYLDKNGIPVQFTEEDFDQALSGNLVAKVIYLPDPEHQDPALAGVETIVSTHVDPGLDPIVEADRRGAILAVVRIANTDVLQSRIWVPGRYFP